MEQLPYDIEQKLENLPVISFDNPDELQKIIASQDFLDILTYYEEHFMPEEFKKQQEVYKRIALYLTLTNQDVDLANQIDGIMYRRPVPSIEEFLSGKFYMYNSNATLYPYWRQQLEYMFKEGSQIRKTIFGGSVGVGKSTIARKAFLYVLYRILCLRNARAVFNIDQDATIANIIISMTLKQVYDTNLMPFIKLMEAMPCFQRVMRMQSFDNFDLSDPKMPIPWYAEKSTGTIFFPDNIIIGCGSGITHTIGYNIVNSFCLHGKTKIRTTNDDIEIEELCKRFKNNEKFKTYDLNGEEIDIINIKQTGKVNQSIKIWFDEENYIECTENHKFLIKNPNRGDFNLIWINNLPFKEAKDLTENDEIEEFII